MSLDIFLKIPLSKKVVLSVVRRPAAAASQGHVLEMQVPGPKLIPIEPEILKGGA